VAQQEQEESTLADPEEIPASLHLIAHRIPEDTRANLTPLEMRIRCEAVLEVQGLADASRDPSRAERLGKKAERMIKAMSPDAYAAALRELEEAMADANKRGDTAAAYQVLTEIHQLQRNHPQPEAERYMKAAIAAVSQEVDRKLTIPPRTGSRLFSRKRGRK
jgi:hypothetical protein